jgi:protein-L-isoaspartate(D-aspartate) O-methyltransferase
MNRRIAGSLFLLVFSFPGYAGADEYAGSRAALMREIAAEVRETGSYLGKNELDARVVETLSRVPRHEFVPKELRGAAYENRPLPIGHGQTISQPYIVAVMTDLLRPTRGQRVLEVGTGSGYQAAVLAELVDRVYTIEIIEPLGNSARERLARLGYDNITVRTGDGYYGWEEHAPFDAIVVTAAAGHVPPPLIRQLKPGGRMVIPVGSRHGAAPGAGRESGSVTRQLLPVAFVPLTGSH